MNTKRDIILAVVFGAAVGSCLAVGTWFFSPKPQLEPGVGQKQCPEMLDNSLDFFSCPE
jgi:hypothetical protein